MKTTERSLGCLELCVAENEVASLPESARSGLNCSRFEHHMLVIHSM